MNYINDHIATTLEPYVRVSGGGYSVDIQCSSLHREDHCSGCVWRIRDGLCYGILWIVLTFNVGDIQRSSRNRIRVVDLPNDPRHG